MLGRVSVYTGAMRGIEKSERRKRNKLILWIVLAFGAIIGLALLGYYIYLRQSYPPPNQASGQPASALCMRQASIPRISG
jgi:hypothetical protein